MPAPGVSPSGPGTDRPAGAARVSLRLTAWIMLVALCLIFRFVDAATPLNHDLGTYGYSGWRILEGDAVYAAIWNHKTPGYLYVSAFWMALLGATPGALQAGATVVMLASVLVFAAVARRIAALPAAGLATAVYAFHLFHPWWSDGGALIEAANTLPALAAALAACAWFGGGASAAALGAGLAGGIAFWLKQPAGSVLGAIAVAMILCGPGGIGRRVRGLGMLTAGALVVPGAWVCTVIAAGRGPLVWDQVVGYNAAVYASEHYYAGLMDLLYNVAWHARFATALLLGAAAGLVPAVAALRTAGPAVPASAAPRRPVAVFVLAWAALDVLAVVVQDKYFRHHFVQLVPSFSLLALIAIERALLVAGSGRSFGRRPALIFRRGLVVIMVASSLAPVLDALRFLETRVLRPVPSAAEALASWIAERTGSSDAIFVWGTDPVPYFLARRASPSLYYDCDAVMVPGRPDLAARLLADLEADPPAVIADSTYGPDLRNHRFLPLDPARPPSATPTPGFAREQLEPLAAWIRARYEPAAAIGGEYVAWVPKTR